jgi:hypothetical protein
MPAPVDVPVPDGSVADVLGAAGCDASEDSASPLTLQPAAAATIAAATPNTRIDVLHFGLDITVS